jgi:hypothetical protein
VRRLPVVDTDGRLIGLLALNDAILHASDGKGRTSELSEHAVMDTLKKVSAHRDSLAYARATGR